MRIYKFFILFTALFAGISYQNGFGQTAKPTGEKQQTALLEDIKTNSKYGLSVLFYSDLKAETSYLIIRNDKTKQEVSLPYLLSGEDSMEIWSPEEEYLVLPNIYSMSIYKSQDIVKIFNDRKYNPDTFYDNLKSIDKLLLETNKKGFDLRHSFVRWEKRNLLVFNVDVIADDVSKNLELGEFRYDLKKTKLYRLIGKDVTLSKTRHKFIKLYKIFGRNRTHLIYSQFIKTQVS